MILEIIILCMLHTPRVEKSQKYNPWVPVSQT